jgi:hypothetical protein
MRCQDTLTKTSRTLKPQNSDMDFLRHADSCRYNKAYIKIGHDLAIPNNYLLTIRHHPVYFFAV